MGMEFRITIEGEKTLAKHTFTVDKETGNIKLGVK